MKFWFKGIICALLLISVTLSGIDTYDVEFSKEKFLSVEATIKDYLVRTPLIPLPTLSELTGKKIFIKDEARQIGGSFKSRGVSYEVFSTIKKIITEKPEMLKKGLQLVTQTDGNHGIALILSIRSAIEKYSKEYPQMKDEIQKIEPVIFTYKNVLSVKRDWMEKAITEYRTTAQNQLGKIYDSYKDYGDAKVGREKYLKEQSDRAIYMEHGGLKTMQGHGVAAIEIVEQLEQLGEKKDQKVCLLLPIGAGGPIGLAAAIKAFKTDSLGAMIQTPRYGAFIRSLKSGKMEKNDDSLSPYTVQVEDKGTLKSIIYEDGISVDGPESQEALEIGLKYLDDALYANPTKALEISPLLLRDLDAYYNAYDKSEGIVGGTTAIVAEAILSNSDAKCIKESDIIVIFGTEGSIDSAVATYTRKLLESQKQ